MKVACFSNQDELYHYKKSLVLSFHGPRHVLSTGPDNGGYREDLEAVFNVDINPGAGIGCEMRGETYEEHMDVIATEDLGLDPKRCTGLCTAASMDNVAICTKTYEDFTVTAIVTAGIEHNGGRVGDPAQWHERNGEFCEIKPGTINILLHIDADLSKDAMVRSVVTCTEAKVAAIQELLAPSCSSRGIATGSGTDGTIVISNPQSKTRLTNAGKTSKLGEYIGLTVKQAVKEALFRQTGICGEYQHDVLRRLGRFGVTEDNLWQCYLDTVSDPELSRAEFTDRLDSRKKENRLVTYASLYAHLLDQLEWELLRAEEVWDAAKQLLQLSGMKVEQEELPSEIRSSKDIERALTWITRQYLQGFVKMLLRVI